LILAREEKGESLWHLERKQEAVAVWKEAVGQNPRLVVANNFLTGAAASSGENTAQDYEKKADQFTPSDPLFHWVIALRLQNAGMSELAEKHFQQAIRINPEFRKRRDTN
jgi:tetratricopeptide (TPR) repeat protein